MNNISVKDFTKMAMVTALVFVATYTIKIPMPTGYTHLGDCMIFIGVLVLGRKKGAISGALGAALADILGGYMMWVIPTLIIKFVMATIMGFVVENIMKENKANWLFGSILGGVFQIFGYTFVEGIYYSFPTAISTLPTIILQTAAGIVITSVLIVALNGTGIIKQNRGYVE